MRGICAVNIHHFDRIKIVVLLINNSSGFVNFCSMMSVVYHQVHLSRIHAHIASKVLIERYNNLMIEPSLHEFDPT